MPGDGRFRGGVGPPLPGIVGPAEVDGRAEWVPVQRDAGLLEALAARLGSEVDLHRVVLAVLAPLCSALDGAPLGALLAHLSLPLARELGAPALALGARVRAPGGAGDYLLEVSRLALHPPAQAATYVRAVFAAARDVLRPAEAQAIAARLPGDLAELWRTAR
jgi:hypothetical protein